MGVTFVLAMDEAGLIGRDGGLPWRLPEDLKHFRRETMGKTLLMGRTTFDSLGRPLDGRDNWVLTRQRNFVAPDGVVSFSDPDSALQRARSDGRELMVIGGAQIYQALLAQADRILLTRVHARLDGDTWYSDPELSGWCARSLEVHGADARHAHPFSFLDLIRR